MYIEEDYAVIMLAFAGETPHPGTPAASSIFRDVPYTMHPMERPHPPLWYGIGSI